MEGGVDGKRMDLCHNLLRRASHRIILFDILTSRNFRDQRLEYRVNSSDGFTSATRATMCATMYATAWGELDSSPLCNLERETALFVANQISSYRAV